MAINPNRQQARLTKSKEMAKPVIAEIEKLDSQIKNLTGDLDQIMVRTQLHENSLTELQIQMKAFLDAEQNDETKSNIARVTDEMKQVQDALALAQQEYTAKREECTLLTVKQFDLHNGPSMRQIRSQETALKRKEASYPTKLKRHLCRARRNGFADARLTGGKKK
jgi:hypothetical protein